MWGLQTLEIRSTKDKSVVQTSKIVFTKFFSQKMVVTFLEINFDIYLNIDIELQRSPMILGYE